MKLGIIGAGESGVGAALLAKKYNYEVFLSDGGKIADDYKNILIKNNIPFEEEGHDIRRLSLVNMVVKSPGVPDHAEVVTVLRSKGVKIISEIEFGFLHYKGKVLAITGSNGKTTTSGLLYHLLQTAGLDVILGGNIGESFAGILAHRDPEYAVLEVSSFQLDDIDTFRPHVAILLNITPDHLDRYQYNFDLYANAKFRIFENQSADDFLIYNADSKLISEKVKMMGYGGPQLIPIFAKSYENGLLSKAGKLFDTTLSGKHNLFNARCAIEAVRCLGVDEEVIAIGLQSFVNQPHRLELVAELDGVRYINDSKATNVDSVWYALDAMEGPVIWVVGGIDKGNDYTPLMGLVADKVKAIICLGVDNAKLRQIFKDKVQCFFETTEVSEVVSIAREISKSGDIVLLSPACASFDLFRNYMDRGNQFKQAVHYALDKTKGK